MPGETKVPPVEKKTPHQEPLASAMVDGINIYVDKRMARESEPQKK